MKSGDPLAVTRPELHADHIGTLWIDSLSAGRIRGYAGEGSFTNIGDVILGNVYGKSIAEGIDRPSVHIHSFTSFDVLEHFGGDVLLKYFPSWQYLRIGGRTESRIGPGSQQQFIPGRFTVEPITVADGVGQVIINAQGLDSAPAYFDRPAAPVEDAAYSYCAGLVTRPAPGGPRGFTWNTSDPLVKLPEYNSTSLYDGAVGFAPFALHDALCVPPRETQPPTTGILQTEFSDVTPLVAATGITLEYYGPVRTQAAAGVSPYVLEFHRFVNGRDLFLVMNESDYEVTLPRGNSASWSRKVTIKGRAGYTFMNGHYRLEPKTTNIGGKPAIYCDLLDNDYLSIDRKGYWFRLGADCDQDGFEDAPEFTCDGGIPCRADYNEDGGVDGSDVEAFFTEWQTGVENADVNQDGGVDGADVESFITQWAAGGC